MFVSLYLTLFVMTSLKLASYNCNGHSPDRLRYVQSLIEKHDFVLVQEHWLLQDQLNTFQQHIDNIQIHGISGMVESELLRGRPYGGCDIIWKKLHYV